MMIVCRRCATRVTPLCLVVLTLISARQGRLFIDHQRQTSNAVVSDQTTDLSFLQQQEPKPQQDNENGVDHTAEKNGGVASGGVCPSKAVTVYLPSNEDGEPRSKYVAELRWLLLSWAEMKKHLDARCRVDVIVVAVASHHSVEEIGCLPFNETSIAKERRQQQQDPSRCIVITGFNPLAMPNKYMNSIEAYVYALTTYASLMNSYDLILRSDIDTFLTPAFATWTPSRFTVGGGGFCFAGMDTCARLGRIGVRQQWLKNTTTMAVENIGSTWYGSPRQMLQCCRKAMEVGLYLDRHEFTPEEKRTGNWPCWHYGVLSMYSGQIAIINCTAGEFDKRPDMLDVSAKSPLPVAVHAHLHCWQGDKDFKKKKFLAGGYANVSLDMLDMSKARDYALGMALRSLNSSLLQSAMASTSIQL